MTALVTKARWGFRGSAWGEEQGAAELNVCWGFQTRRCPCATRQQHAWVNLDQAATRLPVVKAPSNPDLLVSRNTRGLTSGATRRLLLASLALLGCKTTTAVMLARGVVRERATLVRLRTVTGQRRTRAWVKGAARCRQELLPLCDLLSSTSLSSSSSRAVLRRASCCRRSTTAMPSPVN